MASNQLPTNAGQLIGLATKMDAGLNKYGTELKIAQITPAEFDADLKAFSAQDGSYNPARSARQDASNDYQAATSAVADWLRVRKNVLMGRFGDRCRLSLKIS